MSSFDHLQALWAAQHVADGSGEEAAALAARLKRFGRREVSIGATKAAVVCVAVIPALWLALRHATSPVVIAGALWSAAAVVVVVALQRRDQDMLSRLDYAATSSEFVDSALGALERYQAAAVNRARGLTAALVVGLNAMVLGTSHGGNAWSHVVLHLVCTLLPLAAYGLGVRMRRRRTAATCEPLRRHLEEIRDRG